MQIDATVSEIGLQRWDNSAIARGALKSLCKRKYFENVFTISF